MRPNTGRRRRAPAGPPVGNRSLERLTPAQLESLRTPRLRTVDRGTNIFGSLARSSGIAYDAGSVLRWLNRSFPDGDIGALERVKTLTVDD